MPKSKLFKRYLKDILPEGKAEAVLDGAQTIFHDIVLEHPLPEQRSLRSHTAGKIYPGAALYLALMRSGYSQDTAFKIMEDVFRQWGKMQRRRIELMAKWPIYYSLLKYLIRFQISLSFPEEGWEIEWIEVSRKQISIKMTSCHYLDVLSNLGLAELTRLYCWMDDLIHEEVSPYVAWARDQTLGRGDECCDFQFINLKELISA
jgi:hypothetical protein